MTTQMNATRRLDANLTLTKELIKAIAIELEHIDHHVVSKNTASWGEAADWGHVAGLLAQAADFLGIDFSDVLDSAGMAYDETTGLTIKTIKE